MKVVFFGSSKFVIPILDVLRRNFNISLVLTTEKSKQASQTLQGLALRSYLQGYPVIKYCVENKIPYLPVQQFNNLTIQRLQKSNSSVGILTDFGLIIPPSILNLFPKGIINIHPSLLPKYKGPTPVQTAILSGDKTTGVTIIKLDEAVDHGPILKQEKERILDTDTAESLYERLFEKGAKLLLKVLNNYLKGNLKLTPQNHEKATFTSRLTRTDGYVDISKLIRSASSGQNSKLKIDRMIRAYFPWPGVWFKWKMENGKWKIIKLLPFGKIQVEGKKPVSYKDFLNGYPQIKQQLEKLLGQLA